MTNGVFYIHPRRFLFSLWLQERLYPGQQAATGSGGIGPFFLFPGNFFPILFVRKVLQQNVIFKQQYFCLCPFTVAVCYKSYFKTGKKVQNWHRQGLTFEVLAAGHIWECWPIVFFLFLSGCKILNDKHLCKICQTF